MEPFPMTLLKKKFRDEGMCSTKVMLMNRNADVNAALVIRGRAQLALSREPHTGQQPVTLHDVA